MSVVCSKCGASLVPNASACKACGMAVAAPPVAAYTRVVLPLRAPDHSGLVRTALLTCAMIAVLATCGFVLWRENAAAQPAYAGVGARAAQEDGGGPIARELGAPVYPGAQSTGDPVHLRVPNGHVVTGVFLTSASKKDVIAFYQDKLGASVVDTRERAMLTSQTNEAESIMVTVSANDATHQGQTKIVVVHTHHS